MKSILLILFLLISPAAFCQIKFIEEYNWERLSQMAKADNKLIFVHFENKTCEQCNEVASVGFSSAILKDQFEKHFLSVRVKSESDEGRALAAVLGVRSTLISLYVNSDGNVLSSFNGSTSKSAEYLRLAEVALERKDKKKLSDYEAEYRAGERSVSFLKAFIISRAESGLSADDLLELYLKALPADSLNNFSSLEFIYMQGPAIDSRAYNILQSGSKNSAIDSMYSNLPSKKAEQISDAIVANSFRKAVAERNEKLAMRTAIFSMKIFVDDLFSANLAYHRNVIRYYRNTSNVKRYVQEAKRFLDSLHMNMTIDSLTAFNDRVFKKMEAERRPKNLTKPVATVFAFSPPSQFIIKDLNDNAWHFYEIMRNKTELEHALKWSDKAIELLDASYQRTLQKMKGAKNFPPLSNANILDTNARLLYRLDRKEEAIAMQNRAIASHKLSGMPTGSFEKTLLKMIEGTL